MSKNLPAENKTRRQKVKIEVGSPFFMMEALSTSQRVWCWGGSFQAFACLRFCLNIVQHSRIMSDDKRKKQ